MPASNNEPCSTVEWLPRLFFERRDPIPRRNHGTRGYLRSTLVMGLTVALMWFFLRSADLSSVWSHIGRARLDLMIAAFSAVVATFVMRVKRWQSLLVPLAQVEFAEAARATFIGVATTAVLPGRVGRCRAE